MKYHSRGLDYEINPQPLREIGVEGRARMYVAWSEVLRRRGKEIRFTEPCVVLASGRNGNRERNVGHFRHNNIGISFSLLCKY